MGLQIICCGFSLTNSDKGVGSNSIQYWTEVEKLCDKPEHSKMKIGPKGPKTPSMVPLRPKKNYSICYKGYMV